MKWNDKVLKNFQQLDADINMAGENDGNIRGWKVHAENNRLVEALQ